MSSISPTSEILRERFGHAAFREGQEAVVQALLEGRPALAVFPTGGGKSLCYQLPALLLDGLTLVVSPLIALMKDQVDELRRKGIPAARLDSTLDAGQLAEVYAGLESGELKILYVAPERFSNEAFRLRVKKLPICLLAIDEAHCISEWGHNFRPDYLKLAAICRKLRISRVLCLTATATPKVSRNIRKAFRIAAKDHIQLSFHRPNLELRVTPCAAAERKSMVLERLSAGDGAAVVYVTRQETAEEVATFLAKSGLSCRAYHAGLPAEFRAEAQQSFMSGGTRIMVATIAFGMGIDKSNIRAVYHYNIPKSLDNHVQEIGRAGRDGLPAVCEMLVCGDDLTVLENFIYSDTPSPRALENLIGRVLRLGPVFDVSPYDLSTICDIRPGVVSTLMTYLEIDGIVEATGSFYDTYRARLLTTPERILAGRSPAERKLIQRILDSGEMKRWWWHFRPRDIAESYGITREKVVAAIQEMQVAGDISLKVSGVRQGYKVRKAPENLKELTAGLVEKFQAREQADLARLRQVLDLSGYRGCLTGYLTKHFGEKLSAPCGHCDRCRGVPAKKISRRKPRQASDAEIVAIRALAHANHAALSTPRQLARFLCGMASPAATRARLTRNDAYGLLAEMPFADVLAIAEAAG